MKQAIIDIGSNSMRLTVYETDGSSFKILFKEKVMAGLAGYVENGVMSDEGIACANNGLLTFRETIESLDIKNVSVFATASLRNIENTDEAIASINASSGYSVEMISGEEEALFGYIGAMKEFNLRHGAFINIGGASTEIAVFADEKPLKAISFSIGSLKLYRECVKNILPGEGSLKRMHKMIITGIDKKSPFAFGKQSPLVCVGGTARAVLEIAKKIYSLSDDCHKVSASQFDDMCSMLYKADKTAADLILKLEPDRIHTMIPGVMILQHILHRFKADEIVVSKYGVREGYLCQKVLQSSQNNTHSHKTEN